MIKPKVYVTQESAKRVPGTHNWVPIVDLSPALEYGEIVVLLPPGSSFFASAPTTRALKEGLREFTDDDFLLPLGDPIIMISAAMIASQRTGGKINVLKWDRQMRTYVHMRIEV